MTSFSEQKEQLLELLQAVRAYAREHGLAAMERRLGEASARLEGEKLWVVVCGEFKRGKSSLANALLDEPDLFPVDLDITTSLVTTVTYGEQTRVAVALGPSDGERLQEIGRERIADYATEQGNRDNVRQARLLTIELPNPKLRNGLTLVDTPGVGGLNTRHTEITYAVIPNADAVIFVTDALSPLTEAELRFVRMIAEHCDDILFVVAKIDVVEDVDAIVESNRERLAHTLGRPASTLTLIPVSSRAKLDFLLDRDPEDLLLSNFGALEERLWSLLSERRGTLVLARTLAEVADVVRSMRTPLHVAWEALQQRSQAELDALEDRFRGLDGRYRTLLGHDAPWRRQLSRGVAEARERVMDEVREGFASLRGKADGYLDDARLLRDPKQIVGLLETDIDALIARLGKRLSSLAARLHTRIVSATGFDLDFHQIGELPFTLRRPAANLEPRRTGWWSAAVELSSKWRYQTTAGATVGSAVGGAVGGMVGALFGFAAVPAAAIGAKIGAALGSIGGFTKSIAQAVAQAREPDLVATRAQVSPEILRYIGDASALCGKLVDDAIAQLEVDMTAELLEQVNQEKQECEATRQTVHDSRQLTGDRAVEQSARLHAQLERLDHLQASVDYAGRVMLGSGGSAAGGGYSAASASAPL